MKMYAKFLFACFFLTTVKATAMDFTLSEDQGFDYLIANEEFIYESDAPDLKKILEAQVKRGAPTAILLTSPGGALEIAEEMAKIILENSNRLLKETKHYNMIVINEECSSACAILMAAITSKRDPKALKIFVTSNAKFGFHAPQELVDGKVKPIKDRRKRLTLIEKQRDALIKHKVPESWIEKHESAFVKDKMTNLKASTLCSEKSGIIPSDSCVNTDEDVTVLVERHTCRDGRPELEDTGETVEPASLFE